MTPDNFAILDAAVIEKPEPFYHALLAHAPVYQVPGSDVFLVSSWELIHHVLANQDDYSANLTGILIAAEDGSPQLFDFSQFGGVVDALANADEPFHAVHRKLVLPQLTARRIAAMEPEVHQWIEADVRKLLAQGGGDAIATVANPIPVKVMARLVGLPVEDVDTLLQWAFAGGDILAGTVTVADLLTLSDSTGELAAYLSQHLQRALANPTTQTTTVLQSLAKGIAEGVIDEREAIGILVVLVGAAGESTSSLMGSALRLLAQDADLQATLRADSHNIMPFIEEVLRLESPFKGHYRAVLRETELGGVRLGPEHRVLLLWAAANRDPGVFAQADQLILGRRDGSQHLGFGHGIHFCIGARLARMETRILLEVLLANSSNFSLADEPRHVPSIFVRRLAHLPLSLAA